MARNKIERKRKKAEDIPSVKPPKKSDLYSHFKQGDVLFGLKDPRDKVIDVLKKQGYTYISANALNSPATKFIIEKNQSDETLKELTPTQLQHYHFLSKHVEYIKREPGKTIPNLLDKPSLGAAFRRACKLLLINRDPDRSYNAHVITTDINWEHVCDKSRSGLGVTDSEMRAAYRDAKANGINPHIFFYNERLELLETPPWKQPGIKEHFNHYERQRENKKRRP